MICGYRARRLRCLAVDGARGQTLGPLAPSTSRGAGAQSQLGRPPRITTIGPLAGWTAQVTAAAATTQPAQVFKAH